jgi:putative acetyltransferase
MITTLRTTSSNADFVALVKVLDLELAQRDGDDAPFYAQYNTIDVIKHVVVAYDQQTPVGCGAIKQYTPDTMEVKRMFVPPEGRNKGTATIVLRELERWARELTCVKCVLETGKRQPEAIALYLKNGYRQISNYGQYVGMENSVCFEKDLLESERG